MLAEVFTMETSNYWKLFESTGQVEDYLAFKQHGTQEETQNADDDNGPGAAGDKDGRS